MLRAAPEWDAQTFHIVAVQRQQVKIKCEWVSFSDWSDAALWYLWFSIQRRCRRLWWPQGRKGPGPNPQTSHCCHPPTSYLPNPPATNPRTHWTWGPLIIFPCWRFYKLMDFFYILNVLYHLVKYYKHTKSKMGMSHCSILDMATYQYNVIQCCFVHQCSWTSFGSLLPVGSPRPLPGLPIPLHNPDCTNLARQSPNLNAID